MRFFVINLYNICCRFCKFRQGDYIKKVEESDYKVNFWGLWNFLLYGCCEIKVFIKDIWKKLFDFVIVLKKCKK